MKNKGLILVSCLAAGALVASPAMAKPMKKFSVSKSNRTAPHTTQMARSNQNVAPRMGNTRNYSGTRFNTTRSYAGRQYTGTRHYSRSGYYGNNYYGRGTHYYGNGYYAGSPYYYGNGWGYGSSSVWPYVAASVAPYVASSWWAPGYRYGYPYSYGGYPYNNYSYYSGSYYGYAGSTVAAVQRRLGRLGYYHGVVDGVIGPQTRGAIAAFESRNGLAVDGTISRPLLDSLGLA